MNSKEVDREWSRRALAAEARVEALEAGIRRMADHHQLFADEALVHAKANASREVSEAIHMARHHRDSLFAAKCRELLRATPSVSKEVLRADYIPGQPLATAFEQRASEATRDERVEEARKVLGATDYQSVYDAACQAMHEKQMAEGRALIAEPEIARLERIERAAKSLHDAMLRSDGTTRAVEYNAQWAALHCAFTTPLPEQRPNEAPPHITPAVVVDRDELLARYSKTVEARPAFGSRVCYASRRDAVVTHVELDAGGYRILTLAFEDGQIIGGISEEMVALSTGSPSR